MEPTYDYDSGALCLPREDCEALCDSLGAACNGIEMHVGLPRCYLIGPGCSPDDLVQEKKMDAFQHVYEYATKILEPVTFLTYSRSECKLDTELSDTQLLKLSTSSQAEADAIALLSENYCNKVCAPRQSKVHWDECIDNKWREMSRNALCLSRADAEAAVALVDGIHGFRMMKGKRVIQILQDGDRCGKDEVSCALLKNGNLPQTCALPYDYPGIIYDWVIKVKHPIYETSPFVPPCFGVVAGSPLGPGAAMLDGSYELALGEDARCDLGETLAKGATPNVCYVGANGRLVWADSSVFDKPGDGLVKRCSGWVLQTEGKSVYATFADGTCPSGSLALPPLPAPLYRFEPEVVPPSLLDFTCAGYSVCPQLQTCVLSSGRHAVQLAATRFGYPKADFIVYADPAVKAQILDPVDGFVPKTIITVERADAFIAKVKAQYPIEIFRNVPDHTRVKVKAMPADGAMMFFTLQRSTPGSFTNPDTDLTDFELGYELPDGYEPWLLDIMRIETFTTAGEPATGTTTLEIYAPGAPPSITVGFFEPIDANSRIRGPKRQPTEFVPADKVTPIASGVFRVELPFGNGDYLVTTESPCGPAPFVVNLDPAAPPCGLEHSGATCPLVCLPGFRADGPLTCSMGSWTKPKCGVDPYVAETHYFRVEARGRLDYGWRIREIVVTDDESCDLGSRSLPVSVLKTSGAYNAATPKANLADGEVLQPESTCTQTFGCKDWWSTSLNANPYSVDETHEKVFFEFSVAGPTQFKCISIVMRSMTGKGEARQYFPSEAVLLRGFSRDAGADVSELSLVKTDGWTSMWKMSMKDPATFSTTPKGAVYSVKPTCGLLGHAIGDIIHYEPTVPSSCHCQQLCIDKLTEGCEAWRFDIATRECFIQSKTMLFDDGCEGAFLSGEPGIRVTSATLSASGVLTVEGYGFPHAMSRSAPEPARQRVKIIEGAGKSNDDCGSLPMADVVSGLACVSPLICAPAPSSTTSTSATWTGVSIAPEPTATKFTVCFHTGEAMDRYTWWAVDTITVPGTSYSFSHGVLTATMTGFEVAVARPAFIIGPTTGFWDLKLVKKTSMPNYDCRVKTDPLLTISLNTPPIDTSFAVSASVSLALTPADVAALQASPKKAKIAIGAGIATGLGISPDLVKITSITYSDGTVQTFSRRLQANGITVDYLVYSRDVTAKLKELGAGNGFAAMAAAITSQAELFFEGFSGVTVTGAAAPVLQLTKASTVLLMLVNSTAAADLLMDTLPKAELEGILTKSLAGILDLKETDVTVSGPLIKTVEYSVAEKLAPDLVVNRTVLGLYANVTDIFATPDTKTALEGLVDGASDAALSTLNELFVQKVVEYNETWNELIIDFTVETPEYIVEEVPARMLSSLPEPRRLQAVPDDVATWTVTSVGAASGEYFVCFTDGLIGFTQIPKSDGDQFLTIPAPDFRTERQVFGGQRLSARAGETTSLTLAGARLPLLAFGAISVVSGGCGLRPECTYNTTNATKDENGTILSPFTNVSTCAEALGSAAIKTAAATGYTFDVAIGADAAAGEYSLCYCDASGDGSLFGDDVYWAPTLGQSCDTASYMAFASFEPETEAARCSTKCDRGCSGADCYCDAYLPVRSESLFADALCIPPTTCAALCVNQTGCTGIDVSEEYENVCWFTTSACVLQVALPYDHWEKGSGKACTKPTDFTIDAGNVVVTARPRLDGDFVLAPDDDQSVEIVGSDLDPLRDRVYVTWENGVCGFSAPVGASMSTYATNVPALGTVDPPQDDTQGPYVKPEIPTADYRVVEKSYCAGVTQVRMVDLPADDLCYSKCGVKSNPSEPTCAGLMSGVDTEETTSLCLTKDACLDVCTSLPSCYGIGMHRSLPRCFLYRDVCAGKVENSLLEAVADYDFLYKVGEPGAARQLSTAVSTTGILRFAGLTLGAGRYKACFCDHLTAGICKDLSDFAVDVGRIHVSGVSCLLGNPKYVRGVCVPQTYGGLRCYDGTAPVIAPPEPSVVIDPVSKILPAPVVAPPTVEESSWCLYGPEEETSAHPICKFVKPTPARRM
jgi:hypothetical protein